MTMRHSTATSIPPTTPPTIDPMLSSPIDGAGGGGGTNDTSHHNAIQTAYMQTVLTQKAYNESTKGADSSVDVPNKATTVEPR